MRIKRLVGVAVAATLTVGAWAMPAHAQGTPGNIELHYYGGGIVLTGSADHSWVVVRGRLVASTLPIKLTQAGATACTYYGLLGAFGYVADCSKAATFHSVDADMGGGTDIVDIEGGMALVEVYGQGGNDILKASSQSSVYLGGDGGNDTLTLVGGSTFGSSHTARGAAGADTFHVVNGYGDKVYCGAGDGATDTVYREHVDQLWDCNNDIVR